MEKITVRQALQGSMAQKMQEDDNVFIIGEEVGQYQGAYKITQGLLDEFGDKRVIDSPISEHGFAGLAAGAAIAGLRPIVEFMTFNFAMQAIDQIINSAAKTYYMSGGTIKCPIVFRGPNGAAARVGAQHSQNYAATYSHIPGLKVIAPYSANDHASLLKAAIEDDTPVIFLENEILYGKSFPKAEQEEKAEIGKAKIVRAGSDVTICSFSLHVGMALEAADIAAGMGINAEIIDLRTLRPLDTETIINSVKKTNRLITLEEGWGFCGVGASIANIVTTQAFDYLDAPPAVIAGQDVPMPYAANLERLALPQVPAIVEEIRKICS